MLEKHIRCLNTFKHIQIYFLDTKDLSSIIVDEKGAKNFLSRHKRSKELVYNFINKSVLYLELFWDNMLKFITTLETT